jgi:hypothetical protein
MVFFHFDSDNKVSSSQLASNENFLNAKKVLIAAGDSWTNQLKETYGNDRSWVPEFAKLREYDFIIISAARGSSGTQIFSNLVNLLTGANLSEDCFFNGFSDSWLNYYLFREKKVDVIVQWTSIIRDYSEFSAWYKPHTFASLPDLSNDTFKKQMYDEYISEILNEKYYSYKLQIYSWQLQKYFEKWNIPYYFWMGFCDLVPEEIEGTDMDIRRFLNKDRWFNLFEKPNNMADYLYYVERNVLPKRLKGVLTEGGPVGLLKNFSDSLFNLFKENEKDSSLEHTLFCGDLHPSTEGNKIIANLLNEKF